MEATAIKAYDRAYEILKELNLSPETAKEMAGIIVTSKDESLSRWVANKEDLTALKGELKEDIAKLEIRLIKWFVGTSMALAGTIFAIMKLAS